MKRTLLLAVAATLITQQLFAGPWLKSLATAQKKAKEHNSLIFVDLFADWCGWCHKMEQEVFVAEAFQKALDLILTGKTLDARRAKKLGLVDAAVPAPIVLTRSSTCPVSARASATE